MSDPTGPENNLIKRKATVREQPFTSSTPVIGPLIVWLRTAWNNMAARWYVLGMFQQQNEFNDLVVQQLFETETRLIEQDSDQSALVQTAAELTLQVTQLKQRVDALEARLAAASPTDAGANG